MDTLTPGTKFNKWTVAGFAGFKTIGSKSKQSAQHYNCICECGNKRIVHRNSLTNGLTYSCGCIKKPQVVKKSKNSPPIMYWEEYYELHNRYDRLLYSNLQLEDMIQSTFSSYLAIMRVLFNDDSSL